MRLGSLTLSATLSAALLSGCSFIGGQPSKYENPYAKQKAANQGHYAQYGHASAGQHCQIATPRHPIPRGCRPEQVTIGTSPQLRQQGAYGAQGGFPQQPQFGQPQYADGGYGAAVGQNKQLMHQTRGPKKRKPKLRGAFSIGAEKSIDGNLIDSDLRGIVGIDGAYNPQDYVQGFSAGTAASGSVTTTRYTANSLATTDVVTGDVDAGIPGNPDAIFLDNGDGGFDSFDARDISFTNAWSTPINIKGGLEYIVSDNFTTFANVGYTYAEGESSEAASVDGTLYRQTREQPFDAAQMPLGDPLINTTFIPSQNIATFSYDVSALEKLDLEVGGRYYFDPIVKSEGYRTITPFVGASIGVSHVNEVDVDVTHIQTSYQQAFDGTDGATYEVPNTGSTRVYDAQWLPQGQLNIGAEWQVTPGFALAAETGLKVQGRREYADFTNADGDVVSGANGDTNYSIPLTLRGSINF